MTIPSPWLTDWKQDYSRRIEQGTAASTHRAYARDVCYFWQWVQTYTHAPHIYPTTVETILQFCLFHLGTDSPRPLKVSTLRIGDDSTTWESC